MRLILVPVALLSLAACATKPPVTAACTDFGRSYSVVDGLNKLYGDPKGVHVLVTSRAPDGHGSLAVDADVWPLSGPQEPAPPHKARVMLDACTMKLLKAEKLS